MMLRCASFSITLAAPLLIGATASSTDPVTDTASYRLVLQPLSAKDESGSVREFRVTIVVDGLKLSADQQVFSMPTLVYNVDSAATAMPPLAAEDAQGKLILQKRDANGDEGPELQWTTSRATRGPIRVSYLLPAAAVLPPRGPAPPISLTNDGQGMSGAGSMFLLRPPADHQYTMSVSWDLNASPKGARGFSSFGEGRQSSARPLPVKDMMNTFYMAGRIGAWPAKPQNGFFGAWQGKPGFDAPALLSWANEAYRNYVGFFANSPPSYGIFMRYNPVNSGGGVALPNAFVLTYGHDSAEKLSELRFTLAHEMFHTFQPQLSREGELGAWFTEGSADLYMARLPLRFRMVTPDEFLTSLNSGAARYYTSAMANLPNDKIPDLFWKDTRARTLPYDRGMLYLAVIDDQVRKATGGKKSLDDIILALHADMQKGRALSNEDWEAQLREHLGEPAVQAFHRFLAGEIPLPESNAFGPCFRRTTKAMRRYELGFASEVLAQPTRIVKGVFPGSAAAKAGLRDGDEIVRPIPQDAIQGDQTARIELSVRRGQNAFPLSYLPRGETVDAYQWERIPSVPDKSCAL